MIFWLDFIILGAVIGILAFGRNWSDNMKRRAKKGGCQ